MLSTKENSSKNSNIFGLSFRKYSDSEEDLEENPFFDAALDRELDQLKRESEKLEFLGLNSPDEEPTTHDIFLNDSFQKDSH